MEESMTAPSKEAIDQIAREAAEKFVRELHPRHADGKTLIGVSGMQDRFQDAIEKAAPEAVEYWRKRYKQCSKDFISLLREYEAFRAAQPQPRKASSCAKATEGKQDWTPEYVMQLVAKSKQSGEGFKILADAHNAALKAEQERSDRTMETWPGFNDWKNQHDERIRKPLVEALERIRTYIGRQDKSAYLISQQIIDVALASVKEGK